MVYTLCKDTYEGKHVVVILGTVSGSLQAWQVFPTKSAAIRFAKANGIVIHRDNTKRK